MTKLFRIAVLLALPAIVVAQTVTADFGSQSSTAYPIPPGILGAQYSNPLPSTPIDSMYSGGFRTLRMYGWLQVVYASTTPNWTQLDKYLGAIQSVNVGKVPGFKVILELTYTPPWLIPTVQGCPAPGASRSYQVPPNDVTTWAALAQSIVAHVDQKYPGLVTDYEIWNEPELGSFCVYPNDSTTRLNKYLSIYAATAPLIRAQLANDNAVARIGGPTITSTGAIAQFIGGLVNTPSTAPYVDFVSFHKYPAGQSDITGGMLWDQKSSSGVQSLYSRVQASNTLGFMNHYLSVANTVKAGKQPNPTQTRIYLDEYNDDWAFTNDCCRNTPTYSPLFNGLVMVDMLDSVYQGAFRVPDTLAYYSASNPPFCLIGSSGGSCGASNYSVLYPQYYLYSLFGSPNYLNLSAGGSYMANSVSPGATSSGLAATAFWSANQDSIVVVNPTSTSYDSVQVTANNPGFAIGNVTEFLLNSTNQTISSSTLSASSTVNVSIPAYTVVAIKITPTSAPDFTIAASPASQTVTPGSGTTYSAAITAANGFTGTVTFAASGLPAGATASFSPTSVSGSGSSTLTVNTASSTPTGSYPITITGSSGTLQHTAQVTLVVSSTGSADFSLAVTPASRTIAQNTYSTYSVTVSPLNGFSGAVTFAASGLPAGATATFNPTSITGSGSTSMTISCAGTAVPGNYTVTITATSGSIQHTTTVALAVTGFSLSVSPTSQPVTRGNAAAYTATVTDLNGYSATETMSVTGLPSGATATFSPSSIAGSGTSTMTVQTATSTPTGTYTLTVKATSSIGSLYHTALVTLSVQ
jgi:Glycosyl hydrolases family 39